MNIMRLLMITVSLFSFSVLAGYIAPAAAPVAVAHADAEGPVLKLSKAAKLHAGPSGPSKVLEIVWANKSCIWLDKQDVWVQVRIRDNGHIGWIHHDYLKAASTVAGK